MENKIYFVRDQSEQNQSGQKKLGYLNKLLNLVSGNSMKLKVLVISIFTSALMACAGSQQAVTKQAPKLSRQHAGYVYQTVSTSTILAAAIVGYCRDAGAAGYQEADQVWSKKNLPWMKAGGQMMVELSPNEQVRKALIGQFDATSRAKAKQHIQKIIANAPDKIAVCEEQFELIKRGAIDIDKQDVVREALSMYIK